MHYVLVLMAVALAAILVAIVFVAIGRGGEMAQFPNDYAPAEFGALAATDVALLRPPTALWGYHMQATDEALNSIALAISERDVRIASLERQLADLHRSAPMPGNSRPSAADPGVGGTGDAMLADDTRAPGEPPTAGDDRARERGTSGEAGRSGTGWPGPLDLPAPSAGVGESGPGGHGPAPGSSATAWPGWPGAPAATAQPPGPQAQTRPEHPRNAAAPRQQPDEDETW
jgi:hypothetical protein